VEGRDGDDVIDFVLRVKTNNGDQVSAPLNQAEDDKIVTSPMENAKTGDDTEQRSTDNRDVSVEYKTTETAKGPSSSPSSRYRSKYIIICNFYPALQSQLFLKKKTKSCLLLFTNRWNPSSFGHCLGRIDKKV
jgi:hypothetical protein